MAVAGQRHGRLSFGIFELDRESGILLKRGLPLRVQEKPLQLLLLLLECPGEIVSREDLQRRLWPDGTYVDFDKGLNTAVKKLRYALGDLPENPRFIETIPRKGYRFIAPCSAAIETGRPAHETSPSFDVPIRSLSLQGLRGPLFLSILLGLFVLTAAWVVVRWRQNDRSNAVLRPITALPGIATAPSLSPDGSHIAFSWTGDQAEKGKGVDLYVKKVGGEDVLRLTKHSFDFVTSAWSPDGTQIAFQGSSKNESGLYIIQKDGRAERKVRSTFPLSWTALSNLAWSPDGKTIAFVDAPIEGGRERLEFLSLQTQQVSQIQSDDKCLYEVMPAFSHDGKHLAYACYTAVGNFALWLAGPWGQSPRLVKEFDGYSSGMSWSGDDKRLIFSHFQRSHRHDRLREITVADGSVRDLQFDSGAYPHILPNNSDALWPNIAASAGRIAFNIEGGGDNVTIWRADLRHPHSSPIKLIASGRSQRCPQYSPDGQHIAFTSNRGGLNQLFMSDSDGKSLVQLSNSELFQVGVPNWSPDSRRVVFDGWANGHPDLYIVDIVERIPRKLNIGGKEGSVPNWSRDGKWIYFVAGGGTSGGRIYRVSPEGGEPEAITTVLGYGPRESFDGKGVYFVAMPTTLEFATINPSGTEYKPEGMPPLAFHGNWTVVRDGIYFFPAGAVKTLSYFDFVTKTLRQVLLVEKGAPFGLSVSPDQHYLLFTQLEDIHSDIMLVDNFR